MADAPERILAWPGGEYQRVSLAGGHPDNMVEYIRADLANAQVMAHPKVWALVEALRPFDACMFTDNGDVTISTGHLSAKDWLRLRAALRDLETP